MKTYSLVEAATIICGDSLRAPRRWLTRQIAAGRFAALKTGRSWRMTDAQVQRAIELCTVGTGAETPVDRLALAAASIRRRRSA